MISTKNIPTVFLAPSEWWHTAHPIASWWCLSFFFFFFTWSPVSSSFFAGQRKPASHRTACFASWRRGASLAWHYTNHDWQPYMLAPRCLLLFSFSRLFIFFRQGSKYCVFKLTPLFSQQINKWFFMYHIYKGTITTMLYKGPKMRKSRIKNWGETKCDCWTRVS